MRNIIKFDDDDDEYNIDAFSTGSKNTRYGQDFLGASSKKYIQTKGKLELLFSAELKTEFTSRVEFLK